MASNNDILKELEGMNSPLAVISRNMPFEMPQGYFDNLPAQVWERANENVLLPGTAMPHIIHDSYFDNLPEQLMGLIKEQENKPAPVTKRINLWKNIRWAAAAMLVLAIGIGSYRVFNPQPASVEQQLQTISDEAIMSYVEDNIYAFETETIINYMNTADINSASMQLNKNDIEYYLQETGWQ